jgi:hypothetical protein
MSDTPLYLLIEETKQRLEDAKSVPFAQYNYVTIRYYNAILEFLEKQGE